MIRNNLFPVPLRRLSRFQCWIAREKIYDKSQLKTNRPFSSSSLSLIMKARLSAKALYMGMPASLLSLSGITQVTSMMNSWFTGKFKMRKLPKGELIRMLVVLLGQHLRYN